MSPLLLCRSAAPLVLLGLAGVAGGTLHSPLALGLSAGPVLLGTALLAMLTAGVVLAPRT